MLPLLATLSAFFGILPPLPDAVPIEYRGDVQNIMSGMIPRIYNHSYTISADLVVPAEGAEGVIVAEADHLGGFSLFVAGRQAHPHLLDDGRVRLPAAGRRSAAGRRGERAHGVRRRRGQARHRRRGDPVVDDKPVGTGRMDHTVPIRFSAYAGMDIGRDNGGVVDLSYEDKKPFAFTGTVKKVVFDVKPHLSTQDEETLHAVAQHGHAGHGLSA